MERKRMKVLDNVAFFLFSTSCHSAAHQRSWLKAIRRTNRGTLARRLSGRIHRRPTTPHITKRTTLPITNLQQVIKDTPRHTSLESNRGSQLEVALSERGAAGEGAFGWAVSLADCLGGDTLGGGSVGVDRHE
eukprot:scaffold9207_cov84-Cyclotella_meneghiniana.AAC.3